MTALAPAPGNSPVEFAHHIAAVLAALGIRVAHGVIGREIVPIVSGLHDAPLVVRYARSESGAAMMALGDWTQTERPNAIFVTTGPGLTNALTGLEALRAAGAPFVLLSPLTPPEETGRGAIQETGGDGYVNAALLTPGRLFDYVAQIHSPRQLEVVAGRLAAGFAGHPGFAAHLAVPPSVQAAPTTLPVPGVSRHTRMAAVPAPDQVERVVALMRRHRFALWVGSGARRAGPAVSELVERTRMPVFSSPRGLGVADACATFLGVAGNGGHDTVPAALAAYAPEYTLVLGTARGEPSSGWNPALAPSGAFIVVDRDRRAFAGGYPQVATIGVEADIGTFVGALLAHDLPRMPFSRRRAPRAPLTAVAESASGVVHPVALMRAIQRVVVDGSDAPMLADASSAMFWCAHHLEFATAGRYFTEHKWGSIGTAGAAAVGAAAARGGPAVALAGDAGLLMFNELNTAVQYGIPVVIVVLDDSGEGAVAHGMDANGRTQHHAWFPPTDFAAVAIAMGAQGVRVTREADLDGALRLALECGGPCLVDVVLDRSVAPPIGNRTKR